MPTSYQNRLAETQKRWEEICKEYYENGLSRPELKEKYGYSLLYLKRKLPEMKKKYGYENTTTSPTNNQ